MDIVGSAIVQTFNDKKSMAMITYGMTTFPMTMVTTIITLGNDTRCSIQDVTSWMLLHMIFISHNLFGLSSIQKCIVPIKMLTYNVATNMRDEHCKLGKSTIIEALKRICRVVKKCFESKYVW